MTDEHPNIAGDSPFGRPRIIGLLGGVASGKSLVAGYLEELGAARLDADGAGHEVLRQPEVEAAVRERWGDSVFGLDGRIVRSAVARIVFARTPEGAAGLAFLEQLTHPRIGKLLRETAENLATAGKKTLVLDAPVMLKAGWDTMCDTVIYVDAPPELRWERARKRGWSQEDFQAREAAQEPMAEKRRRADYVIDNSGPAEATKSQVAHLWPRVCG